MACRKCGTDCQGSLCEFCAFDEAHESDWQDRLTTKEGDD